MIYVGTSGFSYKEWKGTLYPEDLPASGFLGCYSETFPTTEINATFYRMPSTKIVKRWLEQVPESFRFTLKMNQRITHRKRLQDVEEEMNWFREGSAPLKDRLGAVLVQLPPWLRANHKRLTSFIEKYGADFPFAFEFRHDSWFEKTTYALLEENNAVLVQAETDDREAPLEVSGEFIYCRLRKASYTGKELKKWALWLLEQSKGKDAFVYFKHEQAAPRYAKELIKATA